jgi:hypothetical protein
MLSGMVNFGHAKTCSKKANLRGCCVSHAMRLATTNGLVIQESALELYSENGWRCNHG